MTDEIDDIRPTPLESPAGSLTPDIIRSINQVLDTIDRRSSTIVVQVPELGHLRAAWYVNTGGGWSFATWGERLKDKGLGYGVAIRKTF